MWPGVLVFDPDNFKQNQVAVVYAHKSLVSAFISTLGDLEKASKKDEEELKQGEGQEDEAEEL